MSWTLEFTPRAQKDLRQVSSASRQRVIRYLEERILAHPDPRQLGKPLKGDFAGYWRYRVGDLRIICRIEDHKLVILVVSIGNRREIYR